MKRKVEILVLSDIHLGTKNCQATELLNYLKSIKPNIIILNGNFIETKNFKNLVGDHLRVFGRLVKLLTQGTRIYYLSGEIDAPLRRFADFSNGQLFLRDQLVLKLGGKKYWFLHGNLLIPPQYPDDSWSSGKLIQWFFKRFFSKNALLNRNFEQQITEIAQEEGYDAVVCGYTRSPKIDCINGVEYFNAGDWTNHLTALEFNGNSWTLFRYDSYEWVLKNAALNQADSDFDEEDAFFSLKSKLMKPKEYVVVQSQETHDWVHNDGNLWD